MGCVSPSYGAYFRTKRATFDCAQQNASGQGSIKLGVLDLCVCVSVHACCTECNKTGYDGVGWSIAAWNSWDDADIDAVGVQRECYNSIRWNERG